ncbi:transporter [Lysobacter enzymogenes]|uniref:transporter n=1 Tax=Lysobacter enzymogenes TaxID=69 RepID=UPI001F51768B|nr:transporter [Lysobacter enzymogenes]UZW60724.1 transporter [Lysobacter enzymogenes]
MSPRRAALAWLATALVAPALAQAQTDTPAFDRPGIAFSTGTLPRGGFAWEQGLPDFERDRSGGVRSTGYSAATTLRLGLTDRLELQLSGSPYNYARQRGGGQRDSARGAGDTALALKLALPSRHEKFSWGLLGSAAVATGDRDFSDGRDQYALGATVAYDFDDATSGSLYLNVERSGGADAWTFSPSLSRAFGARWGGYVEAGWTRTERAPDTGVAGAGVTFMATPTIQLDASLDAGLNDAAPDWQGGIGVSVFFD